MSVYLLRLFNVIVLIDQQVLDCLDELPSREGFKVFLQTQAQKQKHTESSRDSFLTA